MLLIIFVCALLVRVLYLLQSSAVDPLFYQPIMDALYHHEWASAIAGGDWLGSEAFFRAPAYPYFLALVYKIGGVNLFAARFVQIIIGSINCVLTARIGTVLFRKTVGTIAGFSACVYPLFIYFDGELLIPTLLLFFILLGFYLAFANEKKITSKRHWLVTGICWGFAAITRPNVLLFFLTVPTWLMKAFKKQWKTALLWGSLGLVLVVLPVATRNYVVGRELVLIAWQGGTNFYIGNNPHADGYSAIAPGMRRTWWGGYRDMKRISEEETGHPLSGGGVDRYWLSQGLKFIGEEPGKALYLLIKKAYLFFAGLELSNNRDIYFFTRLTFLRFFIIDEPFFQFPFGVLFPLALAGIFLFIKGQRVSTYDRTKRLNTFLVLLFIASYAVSFIVFFVCARYRIPIIPFLLIFAGSAALDLYHHVRQKNYRKWIAPIGIFSASFVFFNANIFHIDQTNPGLNYCTLGVAYNDRGESEKAVECYKRSIEIDPDHVDAYYDLGNVYAHGKKYALAKDLYRKAIRIDPAAARAYCNLGNVYFETNQLDSALLCYGKAIELEPDYETPYCHAGLVYYKLGDFTKAEKIWMEYLQINPHSVRTEKLLQRLPKDTTE